MGVADVWVGYQDRGLHYFDGTDFRPVSRSWDELDRDRAVGDGDREGFVNCGQGCAGCDHDIEVRQHLTAIDGHVEDALIRRVPIDLRELQNDVVASIRNRELVGKCAVALRLIESGIRGVIDGAGRTVNVASAEARVGTPGLPQRIRIGSSPGMHPDGGERTRGRELGQRDPR